MRSPLGKVAPVGAERQGDPSVSCELDVRSHRLRVVSVIDGQCNGAGPPGEMGEDPRRQPCIWWWYRWKHSTRANRPATSGTGERGDKSELPRVTSHPVSTAADPAARSVRNCRRDFRASTVLPTDGSIAEQGSWQHHATPHCGRPRSCWRNAATSSAPLYVCLRTQAMAWRVSSFIGGWALRCADRWRRGVGLRPWRHMGRDRRRSLDHGQDDARRSQSAGRSGVEKTL